MKFESIQTDELSHGQLTLTHSLLGIMVANELVKRMNTKKKVLFYGIENQINN